jgi:hypothetical protein
MAAALNKIKEVLIPTTSKVDDSVGKTRDSTVSDNAHPDVVAPKANNRQRGPVEEVIAKRMRQLGKKLVRFTANPP